MTTTAISPSLFNTRLYVGRHAGGRGLSVRIDKDGKQQSFILSLSVPQGVSRCQADTAHCRIDINERGVMTLTNLSLHNVTYVDGVEVATKRLLPDSAVLLSSAKFALPLDNVLAASVRALEKVRPAPAVRYSIAPLEEVWARYHAETLRLKLYQRKVGQMRSIPMMFTFSSGAVTTLSRVLTWPGWVFTLTAALTLLGFVLMVYGFYLSMADKSIEKGEALLARFQQEYVCPNPHCRHFMGMQPYNLLRQNKKCPYCGCEFEK